MPAAKVNQFHQRDELVKLAYKAAGIFDPVKWHSLSKKEDQEFAAMYTVIERAISLGRQLEREEYPAVSEQKGTSNG